jgi:serine/threonine-protein kinase
MGRGLALLESASGEPELPVAEINSRDSIFATSPKDSPLLSVEGQDAPASMRDRIVWEGHGVGYHLISTYRRDQSAQLGSVPTLYDRSSWVVAVGTRELAAFHGDVKFLEEWDDDLPAWSLRREDARVAADSPLMTAGCDQGKIPIAPPSS